MNSRKNNKIAQVRKDKGMTQQQLADELGVHWMTVSKLERGRMQLTETWLEKLSKALGVRFDDLLNLDPVKKEILVGGVIKDGFTVQEDDYPEVEVFPDDDTGGTGAIWYLVEGNDLRPFFYDGDALCFAFMQGKDLKFLVGRLAVVRYYPEERTKDLVTSLCVITEFLGGDQGDRINLRTLRGMNINNVEAWDFAIFRGSLARLADTTDVETTLDIPKLA